MAPVPIGAKAKAKKMQRIVWMPMSQQIPSKNERESKCKIFFAFTRTALALTLMKLIS